MTRPQVEMDFEPGLTQQFPEFLDLLAAVVYGSRPGLSGVAAELDKSPSLLSRMLSRDKDDPRHLPMAELPKIIHATGDRRPIYWLIEKFLEDPEIKRRRALDHLAELMPQLQGLLKEARK
jgi:hypothetical protein